MEKSMERIQGKEWWKKSWRPQGATNRRLAVGVTGGSNSFRTGRTSSADSWYVVSRLSIAQEQSMGGWVRRSDEETYVVRKVVAKSRFLATRFRSNKLLLLLLLKYQYIRLLFKYHCIIVLTQRISLFAVSFLSYRIIKKRNDLEVARSLKQILRIHR